ncbi:Na+/H+ antiporter subunit G [Paraburkholderia youngii]|uniref:Na+/H+ antiporter subunit G n=1 Tax=Paraburkholderia youngii TaxID=2782701 RepID=UPI0035E447E5
METFVEAIVCLLLLVGSLFTLIGAVGLARLPDFFMRLHGPTKSTTLGVGGIVLASVVYFSAHNNFASLHELLIPAFLFLTAPISAHMLAKAGTQQGCRCGGRRGGVHLPRGRVRTGGIRGTCVRTTRGEACRASRFS